MNNTTAQNWLCKTCNNYKGMDDERGLVTRCGNPKWQDYFVKDKDYLLHYASGRPNFCKESNKYV